jgi:hypothetical protein
MKCFEESAFYVLAATQRFPLDVQGNPRPFETESLLSGVFLFPDRGITVTGWER